MSGNPDGHRGRRNTPIWHFLFHDSVSESHCSSWRMLSLSGEVVTRRLCQEDEGGGQVSEGGVGTTFPLTEVDSVCS